MLSTWSDYATSNSRRDLYSAQIKNANYLKELKKGQQQMAQNFEQAALAQLEVQTMSTELVCNNLQAGFSRLHNALGTLAENQVATYKVLAQTAELTATLVEESRRSNEYLEQVFDRLAIPDIQKVREHKLKEGYKHLRNSVTFPDRFHDAHRNFSEALGIEPADYFALYRMGIIYFYSPHHVDLEVAENYFRQAGEYALAEVPENASQSTTALGGEISSDKVKEHAGDALSMQARCQFLMENTTKALEICILAVAHFPERLDILFEKARLEVILRREGDVANTVNTILDRKLELCLVIASDQTLGNSATVANELQRRMDQYYFPTKKGYDTAKLEIIPESVACAELEEVGQLLEQRTLLEARDAYNLAFSKKERLITSYPVYPGEEDYDTLIENQFKKLSDDLHVMEKALSKKEFTTFLDKSPLYKDILTNEELFPYIAKERRAFSEFSRICKALENARQKTYKNGLERLPSLRKKDYILAIIFIAVIVPAAWGILKGLKWLLFEWVIFDWIFNIIAIIAVVFLILGALGVGNDKPSLKEFEATPPGTLQAPSAEIDSTKSESETSSA
ncbi:MAG: hypothetical protein AAFR61_25665 [Bacteroidota bacterium]